MLLENTYRISYIGEEVVLGSLGMLGYFCFRKLEETELSSGTIPLEMAVRLTRDFQCTGLKMLH